MKTDHKHLQPRRAREKHDRRPLVACPHCGQLSRGLEQHIADKHSGGQK